jgi:PhzF family phenazine biosynthesis protein
MTRQYIVYQINSFTEEKFSGNPAGVVLNAEGLTEPEMLLIARELKNSETAFIFPKSNNDDYDVEVRFFTPTVEVPICGHATIAAHYVRAVENQLPLKNISRQKTKAGILPIEIVRNDNKIKISMTQGKIDFEKIEKAFQLQILTALGLIEDDIIENFPIEIASTGHSKVMIGITSKTKLNLLKPNLSELARLSDLIHCNGYFVFTIDNQPHSFSTDGRMFAPAIGINEDPVTGNANGPLGAYLVKNKLVVYDNDVFSFTARQGEAMGRLGSMEVSVDIENGIPRKVQILGSAVTIFKTVIEL